MHRDLRPYWVCIRLDACRTRDELIQARSQYAAGWLFRQLHPGVEVLGVRRCRGARQCEGPDERGVLGGSGEVVS
jgi:hypothetical protein